MNNFAHFLMTYKDTVPWIALVISICAASFSWRGFRINRAIWLSKRPYLNKETYLYHDYITLAGAESEHWKIKSITLLWPLNQTFCRNDIEYDNGGSISTSALIPVGRKLRDGRLPIIVTGSTDKAHLLVVARSKTRPQTTIRRWVTVSTSM